MRGVVKYRKPENAAIVATQQTGEEGREEGKYRLSGGPGARSSLHEVLETLCAKDY